MSVGFPQRVLRHAQIASGLESIDSGLHEPCRRRMAHDVRAVRTTTNRSPRTPQLADGLPTIVHAMRDTLFAIDPAPTPQMG
jgi:hypothetical protein